MQELYDDMLPGITERQAAYRRGRRGARRASRSAWSSRPRAIATTSSASCATYEYQGLDGVLIVMLTYGPGQRVARALGQTRLPLCLANVQPEPQVTAAWDMADMTYNQGVHGAQDTANAMVRAGVTFDVVTEDWHSEAFRDARSAAGRARRPR